MVGVIGAGTTALLVWRTPAVFEKAGLLDLTVS